MSFDFMTLPETTLHYRLLLGDPAQPTFIFENGYGQDLSTWHPILDQIEALGTILMYDRTNTGGSKPHDSETSQQSVNRLHRLICTLSLKPPFIFVGHSYGGTLIRQFASHVSKGSKWTIANRCNTRILYPTLLTSDAKNVPIQVPKPIYARVFIRRFQRKY